MLESPSNKYIAAQPELGQSPETGFDCSGFVRFVLTSAGLAIPDFIGQDNQQRPIRHASEFWDHYGVVVHEGLKQAGDLIVFSRNGRFPTHIGIVLDGANYIHAPGKDGTQVQINQIQDEPIPFDDERQLYTTNPIGFKSPVIAAPEPTYRYHQQII